MLLIEHTMEIIDSVAMSMESVVSSIGKAAGLQLRRLSFTTEINNIEAHEKDTDELLKSSQMYIIEKWNSILQNDIWLSRIRAFFGKCMRFRTAVTRFDDLIYSCDEYESLLGEDCMIARRYLVIAENWYQSAKTMIDIAGVEEPSKTDEGRPGCCIARRFRAFFVGVSDSDLKNLVVSKVPLPRRPKWLLEKRQAVIFGKMLGLTCSEMNRSFVFTGRDGRPTQLNYGHNAPSLNFNNYSIYPLIEKLKAALSLEKERQ